MSIELAGAVRSWNHRFVLADFNSGLEPLAVAAENGLTIRARNAITVVTGIYSGTVAITLRVASRPDDLDEATWEDIAEDSIVLVEGRVSVFSDNDFPQDLTVDGLAPGPYRVRVSARGRDREVDQVSTASEPVEAYELSMWPANTAPAVTITTTTAFAASLAASV
jgi:hypothetical protein